MANFLLVLLFYWASANPGGLTPAQRITLSFDEAIEVIQKGIGAPGVTDREAWEASFTVLETAKRNPELVQPLKQLLVKEVRRIDTWDHFNTELAGGYHQNLVSALFPLADPNLVPLFIRKCKYGSFVKEGFAKLGRPAIPPLIDELLHGQYGRHHTCAAMSLAAIAREGLGPSSQLSPDEKMLLRRDLHDLVVPALERFLEQAREEERAGLGRKIGTAEWRRVGSMPRVAESLEEIRQILSQ